MGAEPFVGIEEASRFLGVKISWLYEAVRLNRVPSYKIGSFRRFRLSELEAWARGQRNAAGEGGNSHPNLLPAHARGPRAKRVGSGTCERLASSE